MKRIRLKSLGGAAALIVAAFVAGCAGIPNDGRYQDHDGGRSNSRAESPAVSVIRSS